jgi:hypothetical protein
MHLWLRIVFTVIVLIAQIGLVVWTRKASASALHGLMRYRGEDLSVTLQKVGEDLRSNPASLRQQATLWALFVALSGVPLLSLIWLY